MKILVVEDEPFIRLGMVSLVEDAGYEAFEASNADDALKKLEAMPDIHLVITDVDMPGSMDGLRLARLVRNRWPPIKLIVISGKVGVSVVELPTGAQFVTKPYQEPHLLKLIADLTAAAQN